MLKINKKLDILIIMTGISAIFIFGIPEKLTAAIPLPLPLSPILPPVIAPTPIVAPPPPVIAPIIVPPPTATPPSPVESPIIVVPTPVTAPPPPVVAPTPVTAPPPPAVAPTPVTTPPPAVAPTPVTAPPPPTVAPTPVITAPPPAVAPTPVVAPPPPATVPPRPTVLPNPPFVKPAWPIRPPVTEIVNPTLINTTSEENNVTQEIITPEVNTKILKSKNTNGFQKLSFENIKILMPISIAIAFSLALWVIVMYNTHHLQLQRDSEKFKHKKKSFEFENTLKGMNYQFFLNTVGEIVFKIENNKPLTPKDIALYKQAAAEIELSGSKQTQKFHRQFLHILQQKKSIDTNAYKKIFAELMENYRIDVGMLSK